MVYLRDGIFAAESVIHILVMGFVAESCILSQTKATGFARPAPYRVANLTSSARRNAQTFQIPGAKPERNTYY